MDREALADFILETEGITDEQAHELADWMIDEYDDRDYEPSQMYEGCPRCYGSGEITTQEPYGEEYWTCPACSGSGR